MKWVAKARSHLRRNIIIATGTLLIVAAIIICLVPTMGLTYYEKEPYTYTETYSETEPYTAIETYTEREPYTTTETYYETEPYTVTEYINYRIIEAIYDNWYWYIGCDCWLTIRNTDTEGGWFTVEFNLITQGGATSTQYASDYIAAGQTKDIGGSYAGDYISTYQYRVIAPTKEVTRYHDVLKSRQVIRYRDVQKEREVTRYRDVEKTQDVVRYEDVAKTRRVTVLEYLLD